MKVRKMSWAYVAGFFDGEGCIYVGEVTRKRVQKSRAVKGIKGRPIKPYYMTQEQIVRVFIGQNVRFQVSFFQKETRVLYVIRRFLKREGIPTSLTIRRGGNYAKDGFGVLFVSRHKLVQKLLQKMYPYLVVKRGKARYALRFIKRHWG